MRLTSEQCERARELLDNPFFDYCVEELEQELLREWTKAASTKEREDLWHQQRLISRLVGRLRSVANNDAFMKRAIQQGRNG